MITISLLIYNISETIQHTQAILNFVMFAYYILYNNKMLTYIKHVLYIFEGKKIVFE